MKYEVVKVKGRKDRVVTPVRRSRRFSSKDVPPSNNNSYNKSRKTSKSIMKTRSSVKFDPDSGTKGKNEYGFSRFWIIL